MKLFHSEVTPIGAVNGKLNITACNITVLLAQHHFERSEKHHQKDLDFMENNVLNQNKCYLPETIPLCEEMSQYTNQFFNDLKDGIK